MCAIDGKCKCKSTNQIKGSESSLTSIAFNTGVMLEQKRILEMLTKQNVEVGTCCDKCKNNKKCCDWCNGECVSELATPFRLLTEGYYCWDQFVALIKESK